MTIAESHECCEISQKISLDERSGQHRPNLTKTSLDERSGQHKVKIAPVVLKRASSNPASILRFQSPSPTANSVVESFFHSIFASNILAICRHNASPSKSIY